MAVRTWDGGGGDDNWSTAANWDGAAPVNGDSVVFDGNTRLTPNNNISSLSLVDITFNNGAGAFVIGGNSITLTGDITNNDGSTQQLDIAISLGAGNHDFTANTGRVNIYGVVSGTGSITKLGTGQVRMTKNDVATTNTYSGGSTVTAGVFRGGAQNDDAFGSGSITLNGGSLRLERNDISNNITVSDDSTLQMGNGFGNTITSDITVNASQLLTIKPDYTNQTINGEISGSGNIEVVDNFGTGTLILGANNQDAFTGNFTVGDSGNGVTVVCSAGNTSKGSLGASSTVTITSGGTLKADGDNSCFGWSPSGTLVVTIETGGTLTNTNGTPGDICHCPKIKFDGGTLDSVFANTNWGNWNFDYGVEATANGGTIGANANVTNSDSPTDWDITTGGTLTVNGVVFDPASGPDNASTKSGGGSLLFYGVNTAANTLTISAGFCGPMSFGSTHANNAITVNSGGTLIGTGNVLGDVTVNSGGTISPDNGASGEGGLTIDKNLVLNSGAILDFGLGTVSDFIDSVNNLTLDGTINVTGVAGFTDTTYTLITYSGTLTNNTLDVGSLPAGFTAVVTTNATQVNLVVTSDDHRDHKIGEGLFRGVARGL